LSKNLSFGLLLALLLTASMWFYVDEVLAPFQRREAAAHGRPRGNLSDLYPRWLGARELLLHHRDPYSPEITREIQTGYYGRPLDPNLPDDPKDQQRFAYPLYVVFFLAPTVTLPFPLVETIFRWLFVLSTLVSIPLWLRAARWRPSAAVVAVLGILTLGSFAVVQGIKLQQLSLMVNVVMAGSAAALVAGYFSLSGILLALAMIKPQLALPMAAWLTVWATGDWRRRGSFVWSFAVTMAVLLAASEFLLPGWMGRFRDGLAAYRQYTGGASSLMEVLLFPWLGKVIVALAIVSFAVLGWRLRRVEQGSIEFSTLLALLLAVTVLIAPTIAPYNHVLLLPGIFLIAGQGRTLWKLNLRTRTALAASTLVLFLPALAACGLMLASLFLPPETVQQAWSAPLRHLLLTPIVVLGLLTVYAIERLKPPPPAPLPKAG